MVYHNMAIRAIVERLNLISLKQLAQQPGVQTVFRFIAYYTDGRAYHSASTLTRESTSPHSMLETIYSGFLNDRPIKRHIDNERYQKFIDVIQQVKFDNLYFPVSDLMHSPTIWCIERATASFFHRLILSPHINQQPYCRIINAVDGYLYETVREIKQ